MPIRGLSETTFEQTSDTYDITRSKRQSRRENR